MQENVDDEKERLNVLSNRIIGAALKVHSELGPGMLESAYVACLAFELLESGLYVERQKPLPLVYRGRHLDRGYRIDLTVEHAIVVEVKSIERLGKVHGAQLLSCLRLLKLKLGLLINFNVTSLRDGIQRKVNGFPD
jgi:GxxExxY protein